MKNTQRNLIRKVISGVLGGVICLTTFGGLAVEVKGVNNNQVVSNAEIAENKKQSEQFYRTKTGKCYRKGNCSCLKKSKIKVTQEEIKEAELKPCKKCFKRESQPF